MTDVFQLSFTGVGSGSGTYRPAPDRLLPSVVSEIRQVCLHCEATETDTFVVEHVGWFKVAAMAPDASLDIVNHALKLIKPYASQEGRVKEPYGAHKDQLRIMHAMHVPKWYVPDAFEVDAARSAHLR